MASIPLRSSIGGLLALACLAAPSACTYPVELAASTTPLEPGAYTRIGLADGVSRGFSFLVMFQFGAHDPIRNATEDALASSGGDALVDVAVDQTDFHFLILFALHQTHVHGVAVDVADR